MKFFVFHNILKHIIIYWKLLIFSISISFDKNHSPIFLTLSLSNIAFFILNCYFIFCTFFCTKSYFQLDLVNYSILKKTQCNTQMLVKFVKIKKLFPYFFHFKDYIIIFFFGRLLLIRIIIELYSEQ